MPCETSFLDKGIRGPPIEVGRLSSKEMTLKSSLLAPGPEKENSKDTDTDKAEDSKPSIKSIEQHIQDLENVIDPVAGLEKQFEKICLKTSRGECQSSWSLNRGFADKKEDKKFSRRGNNEYDLPDGPGFSPNYSANNSPVGIHNYNINENKEFTTVTNNPVPQNGRNRLQAPYAAHVGPSSPYLEISWHNRCFDPTDGWQTLEPSSRFALPQSDFISPLICQSLENTQASWAANCNVEKFPNYCWYNQNQSGFQHVEQASFIQPPSPMIDQQHELCGNGLQDEPDLQEDGYLSITNIVPTIPETDFTKTQGMWEPYNEGPPEAAPFYPENIPAEVIQDCLKRTSPVICEDQIPEDAYVQSATDADKPVTDRYGDTQLHLIALCSDEQKIEREFSDVYDDPVFKLILNCPNRMHQTPLYCCVSAENTFALRLLMWAGADPNTQGMEKDTDTGRMKMQGPLHKAAEKGHLGILLQLLSSTVCDINARRKTDHKTPLMVAIQNLDQHHYEDRRKIVKALIEHGSDLEAEMVCGRSALMMAIESKDISMVEYILKYSHDLEHDLTRHLINHRNKDGNSCLHIAAGLKKLDDGSHVKLVKMLICFGGDSEVMNNEGKTPRDWSNKLFERIRLTFQPR